MEIYDKILGEYMIVKQAHKQEVIAFAKKCGVTVLGLTLFIPMNDKFAGMWFEMYSFYLKVSFSGGEKGKFEKYLQELQHSDGIL